MEVHLYTFVTLAVLISISGLNLFGNIFKLHIILSDEDEPNSTASYQKDPRKYTQQVGRTLRDSLLSGLTLVLSLSILFNIESMTNN
tara:strand:- start:858 stop:1118 length:261 start_codon:yes stop_codon:yes gene_type:complete